MTLKRLYRWPRLLGLIGLIFLVFVPSVLAFESRGGSKITIAANEVIEDDLYVGAEQFVLDGTVKGDLIVGGNMIEINGTVEGDLMAAGQTIIINGTVMDDIRVAAMAVTLGEAAHVNDDLMAVGYSLEMKPGSFVEQNLFFSGAQSLLAGEIGRDATLYASGLALLGQIGGNVLAEVGAPEDLSPFSPTMFVPNAPTLPNVTGGLTVGESASIGGNFDYTAREGITIPTGRVAGEVSQQIVTVDQVESVAPPAIWSAAWFGDQLRRLVALFLIGLLFVWLVPVGLDKTADTVQTRPLPSLGWGLITLLGTVLAFLVIIVVTILLAVVLGGFTLDGLAGTVVAIGIFTVIALAVLFGLTVAYVTKITVSYLAGRLLLARLAPKAATGHIWPLVTGLLIFIVLTAIPLLGGWINFAVVLFGLGALFLLWQDAYRQQRMAPVAMTPQKQIVHTT